MSPRRMWSVFKQEVFISKRSLEVVMDLLFYSLFSLLLFGFISLFLAGQSDGAVAKVVILGLLLWEVIRLTQYTVSVGSMWNVWSRNLTNMFVAPVSTPEYMGAQMISAAVKTAFIFTFLSIIANYAFNFNILSIGFLNLTIIFVNMIVFAWALGLVLLGFVFRYGTRIQALAWGTVFLFQPLCAAFFPVSVLPIGIRQIAYSIPATYFFELGRWGLAYHTTNWTLVGIGVVLNIVFFAMAIFVFGKLFAKSRATGQFARNDT